MCIRDSHDTLYFCVTCCTIFLCTMIHSINVYYVALYFCAYCCTVIQCKLMYCSSQYCKLHHSIEHSHVWRVSSNRQYVALSVPTPLLSPPCQLSEIWKSSTTLEYCITPYHMCHHGFRQLYLNYDGHISVPTDHKLFLQSITITILPCFIWNKKITHFVIPDCFIWNMESTSQFSPEPSWLLSETVNCVGTLG